MAIIRSELLLLARKQLDEIERASDQFKDSPEVAAGASFARLLAAVEYLVSWADEQEQREFRK